MTSYQEEDGHGSGKYAVTDPANCYRQTRIFSLLYMYAVRGWSNLTGEVSSEIPHFKRSYDNFFQNSNF
jgi:hypothetical protein